VDPLLHRRALIAGGVAPHEVRGRLRRRELVGVRRGRYVAGALPTRPEQRHLLQVLAAATELAPDAVVSHVSAAVLHGLPVWGAGLARVHATRSRRSGARRGAVTHLHAARIEADEVVLVRGVRVTSVARTAVDCARALPFDAALVVIDAALHRHLVTRDELAGALARARGRPGVPGAARVLAFADPRPESVGETRSRVALRDAGLAVPVLQWPVVTAGGVVLGEVDFGWPASGVVGEFDGRVEYGRSAAPGQDPAEVLWAEKRREDAIRAEGLAVVRWTWADLDAFAPVAERLRRVLG
jgi:hypothetical protein